MMVNQTNFCVGEPVVQKLLSDDSGLYDTLGEVTAIDLENETVSVTLRADVPRSATFSLAGLRHDGQAKLYKL